MRLNKSNTIRLWFRVDCEAKLFKVLSYDFCDPDNCTDAVVAQFYSSMNDKQKPKIVEMGEWSVPMNPNVFRADEYSLNALNTVMRSINFVEEGVNILNAGDKISDNMTFYFPKPFPTTSVCVGLVPTLPDNTAGQVQQATRFFSAPVSAFRSASDKSPQQVSYTAKFEMINRVETLLERFHAEVTIQMRWQITKADAVEYGEFLAPLFVCRQSSHLKRSPSSRLNNYRLAVLHLLKSAWNRSGCRRQEPVEACVRPAPV